jgi:hypothetical protein
LSLKIGGGFAILGGCQKLMLVLAFFSFFISLKLALGFKILRACQKMLV